MYKVYHRYLHRAMSSVLIKIIQFCKSKFTNNNKYKCIIREKKKLTFYFVTLIILIIVNIVLCT